MRGKHVLAVLKNSRSYYSIETYYKILKECCIASGANIVGISSYQSNNFKVIAALVEESHLAFHIYPDEIFLDFFTCGDTNIKEGYDYALYTLGRNIKSYIYLAKDEDKIEVVKKSERVILPYSYICACIQNNNFYPTLSHKIENKLVVSYDFPVTNGKSKYVIFEIENIRGGYGYHTYPEVGKMFLDVFMAHTTSQNIFPLDTIKWKLRVEDAVNTYVKRLRENRK